jgi:hypothetical protein
LASPEYEAVILWLPTVRVDVAKAACPFDRGWAPMVVGPSRKVIVPLGIPAVDGEARTLAVNVTDWPLNDGSADEMSATPAPWITWVRAVELVAEKLVPAEYDAVMVWLPTMRVEVEKAATPFDRAWVPRMFAPSRNVTIPVGVPVAGTTAEMVTVNVTG